MTTRDELLSRYIDVLHELAHYKAHDQPVPDHLLDKFQSLKARIDNQEN